MKFGETLRRYRLKRLKTLYEIAEETGVSIPTLSNIEHGKEPSPLTRAKIEQRLADFPKGDTT